MEKSNLKNMDKDYLKSIGLSDEQISLITDLVEKGIEEKLYTNTPDFQHDLKHVERVLIYIEWILNEKAKHNEEVTNKNILLLAGLYHDIGKTLGSSNKEHGIVGAKEVRKYLENTLEEKELKIISLLIETHAKESDIVDFGNEDFSLEEQQNIQVLSDILKDADALDRNRLNQPAPFGVCDKNKLRTKEAKEILNKSDEFFKQYMLAIIKEKEEKTGKKILNNYEKLEEWIKQYLENKKNKEEDKGYLFHASMDASITEFIPKESTVKGYYVFAGVDPVNCFTMAAFRMSAMFLRSENKETHTSQIIETFPGTIKKTLKDKFITIYRMPKETFTEYIRKVTSAKEREWISKEKVTPIDEITFNTLDLLEYIKRKGYLEIVENKDPELALKSIMPVMDIWDLKKKKDNPNIIENKRKMREVFINYYAPELLPAINATYQLVDNEIRNYSQKYYKENGIEPDYENENEEHLKKLKDIIKPKLYNKEYIKELLKLCHNQSKLKEVY